MWLVNTACAINMQGQEVHVYIRLVFITNQVSLKHIKALKAVYDLVVYVYSWVLFYHPLKCLLQK